MKKKKKKKKWKKIKNGKKWKIFWILFEFSVKVKLKLPTECGLRVSLRPKRRFASPISAPPGNGRHHWPGRAVWLFRDSSRSLCTEFAAKAHTRTHTHVMDSDRETPIVQLMSDIPSNSGPEALWWHRFSADPIGHSDCRGMRRECSQFSCSTPRRWLRPREKISAQSVQNDRIRSNPRRKPPTPPLHWPKSSAKQGNIFCYWV